MAERLTKKNYFDEYEATFIKDKQTQWSIAESDDKVKITGEPIDKLAQFEDIMEKYGIEDMSELETKLRRTNADIEKAKQSLAEIYIKDRDIWKKACELACEARSKNKLCWELGLKCGIDDTVCGTQECKTKLIDYFYQQAQKEMKNEIK